VQRWSWEELDRLAGLQHSFAFPDPDLVRPVGTTVATRRSRLGLAWLGGMAAAVMLGTGVWFVARAPEARPMAVTASLAAPCERRTLEDGTLIDFNRGAQVEVTYSATARHVRLIRGEANFDVAKDADRPFLVTAGDVTLRAVGTVFNVRLDAHVVEVVVREGQIQMGSTAPRVKAGAPLPLLDANHRVVIPHTPAAQPMTSLLTPQELETRLAWQPRLLDFNDAPLEQIVATFNRHNIVRVSLKERTLFPVRLSATFRSDNVEGFLRLLESDFGVRAEWRGEREVVLHRKD